MNTTLDNKIQNGTYWSGFCLGALTTALMFLATDRIFSDPSPYPLGVLPQDVIKAYTMGLKDALRTNPPSMELDAVCLELWTQRQPGALK